MTDFVISENLRSLGDIIIGTSPAQSGSIRLPNAGDIVARNQNDDGDFNVISFDASANMIIGDVGMPFISFVSQGQFNFAGNIDLTGRLTVDTDLIVTGNLIGGLQIGTLLAGSQTAETLPEELSVAQGNIEVLDPATLDVTVLTDGAFPDSTNWAGAGEWSDVIAGSTTFTFASTGNGTLTQTFAQRNLGDEGRNNRWYKAVYTLSSLVNSGSMVLTITNVFAAAAVTLPVTANGIKTVFFQSNATTADSGDFVLDVTGATAGDTFTMDDLSVREVIGGNIIVAGKMTGGGASGISVDGEGDAFFDGVINFGIAENRAETGTIRFHALDSIVWRDADGDADTTMFAFGASNVFELGDQANPTRVATINIFTPEVRIPAGKLQIIVDSIPALNIQTAGFLTVFNVDTIGDIVKVTGSLEVGNDNGTGVIRRRSSGETHTLALSTSSVTTTVSVPIGSRLIGVSLTVDDTVIDDGGDDTWTAVFSGGSSTAIVAGASPVVATKVDLMLPDEITSGSLVQVTFTPNGGSFSAGIIEVEVYFEDLVSLG